MYMTMVWYNAKTGTPISYTTATFAFCSHGEKLPRQSGLIWRAKRLKNNFFGKGDTSLEIEILLVDSEILLQRSRYFLWIVRYFFRNRDTSMEIEDTSLEIEMLLWRSRYFLGV